MKGVWMIESVSYSMGEQNIYLREGLVFSSKEKAEEYIKKYSWNKGEPVFIKLNPTLSNTQGYPKE